MIPVTKTFVPDQAEFDRILKKAWEAGWLTNHGQLVQELIERLKEKLEVDYIIPTTNGTLPLQIAIKALGLTGEIITTPFSYVASTSAIVWENCEPVFVDIDPDHWTIDHQLIEEKITQKTSAILATHVFGNPCNVEAINEVASKHNLKVIYDGAHCFGVKYKGKSIFKYGDISTCSFHATKLFHTGEGGGIFCNDELLHDKCFYHHNFGHKGPEAFHGLGINAKMSELQAALGLTVLPHVDNIIKERRELYELYLSGLAGQVKFITFVDDLEKNYSYCPVLFESEAQLQNIKQILESNDIYPRRYFFPSLNKLPYVEEISCPIAESISERILCLPLYSSLEMTHHKKIIELIKSNL